MSRTLNVARALVAALALAVAPLAALPAQAQTEQAPKEHGVPVREITSPGGIKAWLVSDSTVPMLVVNAYWKGGVITDPKGREGATSFMADMLTEGAGDMPADAFKVRMEELNISLGFGAGADGVSMGLTTLTKNRDAAFEMARLALMSPRFDAAPLERMKRQSEIGIKQRETNPGYIAGVALDSATIPGHPYAARTSLASIRAIDKPTMEARKRAILARDNMMITIVGDVDQATAGALLDKTFGALPAKSSVTIAPTVAPKAGPAIVVKALPQPQSLVIFSAPSIQDEDPDWIPLVIANYILGGGSFASRLMDEVREKQGLVYGISTGPRVSDGLATLRGSAQTKNESVQKAIDLIKSEIKRLHDGGATEKEVADATTYLTGSFALDLDGNSKIAGVLQSYQTSGRAVDYVNKRNDLIRKVTAADVNRVIKRLFIAENFVFVVVGQPDGMAPTP